MVGKEFSQPILSKLFNFTIIVYPAFLVPNMYQYSTLYCTADDTLVVI